MAFCKFCGKKLEEGQKCNCEEAVNANNISFEADSENSNNKDIISENDDTDQHKDIQSIELSETSSKELPVPAQTISDSMLRRGLVLVCALALCLVLLITIAGNIVGCGYKRPVKNVIKGVNKERAELVINSFYPRNYVEELRDDAEDEDMEWSDLTDDLDSLISNVKEVCEDNYFGDDLKLNAKIVKKKPATAKDFRNIKKGFEKYDAVVKKAYKLKVRLTVKGDDEKEQIHFYIYSVKLKGGRWVVFADDKTKGAISNKTENIYNEVDKELREVINDYSRSLDVVIPKE